MCAQCMAGAATAMTAATGARAWLAAKAPSRLSERRLKLLQRGALVLGVIGTAALGGSGT
jgi:hypothetical protein